jgi:hypothetical protein
MRIRGPLAAALAAMIGVAPALALPAFASATAAPPPAPTAVDAVAAAPKVVIVVGAVEANTERDRLDADQIYAEAIKHTPNVIRIYSPNATYAKVRDAAQGASIFIYLGHGYGFPSPYRPVLSPSVHDGMGLNEIGGVSDSDKKYYGESFIASDFRLARNAVVLLSHACYSAGSSESGDPEPTIPVARERVDNFASGWIKAGARMVSADSWTSGVIYTIASIFTTDQPLAQVWKNAPSRHGHEQPFIPARNPQFEGRLDPNTSTSGFYRSFVGSTDLRTTDVVAGAGAASTAVSTATSTSTDTAPPELWSVDGDRALTPNFDGKADRLNLLARFSETTTWSAELKNAAGDVVRTQAGTGHQAALTWDVKVAGVTAPDGDYSWNLHATDAAGNALDQGGPFTVTSQPTPGTGVLSFAPTTPLLTNTGTLSFALKFATPVTGLQLGDLTRTGSAAGCVIAAPVGAGTDYTIAVTGCGTGSMGLYLNAGTVTDAALKAGPAGPISTARVTIDSTAPKATAPRPFMRTGIALEGSSTTQRLLMGIAWSGSDAGTGIASYDVQRSYDGAAYATIASATTATSLDWTMTPGHTYRFRVRSRDGVGNVSAWTTAYTWYPSLVQQTSSSIAYTGTWTTGTTPAYSGGTVKYATAPGASLTYTFSGRAIALVTTLRSTAGAVEVWIDGVLASTVDTYAPATSYRQVAFGRGWSSYGSHTIKLVVVGTAGHPRVDLDAFEVIR